MNSGNRRLVVALFALLPAVLLPPLLRANVNGADPRSTSAPGDVSGACTSCHKGTALNAGGGSVKILLPGGETYQPGVTQRIQVQVSDPARVRWGFDLTARLASNLSNGQAGDLTSVDGNTQVKCNNGRGKPCSSANAVQFITHTLGGTRLGTTQSAIFAFDWTPPADGAGAVTLYAAGNAANGNTQDSGDHIYTTSVSLQPAAIVSQKPAIKAVQGVVNGASFQAGTSTGAWTTIEGTNLAPTTRTWTAAELAGGLPTSLDSVGVTINGKAAYVQFISPAQINVLSPYDTSLGNVEVRVTNNGQTSDPVTATLQTSSPAFFTFDGKYLAATHADNSLVGKPGLFSSAPTATTAAKPGETIIFYGTGFGPTNPDVPPGQVTTRLGNITTPFTITIGGIPAEVSFGGLVPPFARLYQFNVKVPEGVADGDQPVVAQIGGVTSPASGSCCYVTVQK